MRYKTIGLYYGNGESNLIKEMSNYGWGLIHKQEPNYQTGQKEAFYTFCGGDDAGDILYVDHVGHVTIEVKTPQRLRFARKIKNYFFS